MISAFPKIFAIGTNYIQNIFNGSVEVTEKVDGSQFAFGKVNGELYVRSKGAQLFFENPEKMFQEAIAYIDKISLDLPDDIIFYAEYLKKPKHNSLVYGRIPKNHLILFGAQSADQTFKADFFKFADLFEIESVPVLYEGKINNASELQELLEKESILGGTKIEGVVVKNYNQPFLLDGQLIPIMAGKFVSEKFKEVNRGRWGKEEKSKGRMEMFFESFRTEARWNKAVQHLRERGELENDPRDIGKLVKEVHTDIEEEEKENVKNWLWGEFKNQLKRKSTAGMPEWYKEKLLERSFTD